MSCDICGSSKRAMLTEIEGAKLYVCEMCNPRKENLVQKERNFNVRFNSRAPRVNNTTSGSAAPSTSSPAKSFSRPSGMSKRRFDGVRKPRFNQEDYELVDNYGDVIKKAREAKNLTYEELANSIKEQASYIHKIEQNKLKPNDAVIFKLYNFLGVSLTKDNSNDADNSNPTNMNVQEREQKFVEPFSEIKTNNKRKLVY